MTHTLTKSSKTDDPPPLCYLSYQYICVFLLCFQVPDSGNYTFYVSCDDWCELWMYDVDKFGMENQNKKFEESLTKKPIIALYAWTGHLQWNKLATHKHVFESFFINLNIFTGILYSFLLFCLAFFKIPTINVATNFSRQKLYLSNGGLYV